MLLAKLSDSVSHAYRLDYDSQTRATTVSPGYFGSEQEEAHAVYKA